MVAGSLTATLYVLTPNDKGSSDPEKGAVKYFLPQACCGNNCWLSLSPPPLPQEAGLAVRLLPANTAMGLQSLAPLAIDRTMVPVRFLPDAEVPPLPLASAPSLAPITW